MAGLNLSQILSALDILIKPQISNPSESFATINQVLENNYTLATKLLSKDGSQDNVFIQLPRFNVERCSSKDPRWSYCCLCMETILQLSTTLDRLEMESDSECLPPFLSIQQDKNVGKCFQLIVGLGLLPYLLPNVGIPIQKRSEFHGIFREDRGLIDEQKYYRLTVTTNFLCSVCGNKQLGPQLMSKHLADILAALLQICFAPLKKPTTESEQALYQKHYLFKIFSFFRGHLLPIPRSFVLQFENVVISIQDAPSPAPSWVIRCCARLLTKQLMKPNGVLMVIQGILDVSQAEQWKRCDSLAYIISTPPSGGIEKQREYFSIIGPQLTTLLAQSSRDPLFRQYVRVVASCLRETFRRYRNFAQEFIIDPLFCPLNSNLGNFEELITCVEQLHGIFVAGSDPSPEFLKILEPYLPKLLSLYKEWFQGILQARSLLEDLLVRFMQHTDVSCGAAALEDLLTPRTEEDMLEQDERSVQVVVLLLQRIQDAPLTCRLFCAALENLPRLLNRSSESVDLSCLRRGLMSLKLIASFSQDQQLQTFILENTEQTISFAQVLLTKCVQQIQDHHYDHELERDSLSLIFALVALIIENEISLRKNSEELWTMVEPLVEPLEILAKQHSSERIRNAADDLRIAIKTRGFSFDTQRPDTNYSLFKKTWEELEDPLIPVQGHAILTMSRLLKQRNKETLEYKEKLLGKFLSALNHEDSYIYLMGIQALTSLADAYTDEVVTTLVQQFNSIATEPKLVTDLDAVEETNFGIRRSPEVRLKVGETLMTVVRLLGPIVPKYKGILLNSFLHGTKDEDSFIRASSLSNLGELCTLLRFSLGPILQELFNCVSNLAMRDPAVEVRRAAVFLVKLVLKGLDKDALKILEPVLKDLYGGLKRIIQYEGDSIVIVHAQQALEQLSDIVKEFLVPLTERKFALR